MLASVDFSNINYGKAAQDAFQTVFGTMKSVADMQRQKKMQDIMLPLTIKKAEAELVAMEAQAARSYADTERIAAMSSLYKSRAISEAGKWRRTAEVASSPMPRFGEFVSGANRNAGSSQSVSNDDYIGGDYAGDLPTDSDYPESYLLPAGEGLDAPAESEDIPAGPAPTPSGFNSINLPHPDEDDTSAGIFSDMVRPKTSADIFASLPASNAQMTPYTGGASTTGELVPIGEGSAPIPDSFAAPSEPGLFDTVGRARAPRTLEKMESSGGLLNQDLLTSEVKSPEETRPPAMTPYEDLLTQANEYTEMLNTRWKTIGDPVLVQDEMLQAQSDLKGVYEKARKEAAARIERTGLTDAFNNSAFRDPIEFLEAEKKVQSSVSGRRGATSGTSEGAFSPRANQIIQEQKTLLELISNPEIPNDAREQYRARLDQTKSELLVEQGRADVAQAEMTPAMRFNQTEVPAFASEYGGLRGAGALKEAEALKQAHTTAMFAAAGRSRLIQSVENLTTFAETAPVGDMALGTEGEGRNAQDYVYMVTEQSDPATKKPTRRLVRVDRAGKQSFIDPSQIVSADPSEVTPPPATPFDAVVEKSQETAKAKRVETERQKLAKQIAQQEEVIAHLESLKGAPEEKLNLFNFATKEGRFATTPYAPTNESRQQLYRTTQEKIKELKAALEQLN
jgi:hypothetical protein